MRCSDRATRAARRASRCLAAALAAASTAACPRPPAVETPTFTVARAPFVHRVRAEGHLKATRTMAIPVSHELQSVARIAWLAPDGSVVEQGEVVARLDPTQMQERLVGGGLDLERNRLEGERTRATGNDRVAQTEKDGEIAALELDVAHRYQRTDEDLFSRFQIVESEIDATLAAERRGHADRMRDVHQRLSQAELALLEIERRKVEIAVDQARRGLAMLEVRAPQGGLLLLARDFQGEVLQVGAQVWRGHTLGEIPDLGAMEAEVFVLESDAGGLAVGKPAIVTVSGSPEWPIEATVRRIDAVARVKDRGSPVQYFGATLAIAATRPEIMKPGQRVEATLVLDTLEEAVVVPRQAVSIEQGRARVWLRRERGFVAQPVEIGSQSPGRMVITAGLEPGDVVALSKPAGSANAE